MQRGRDTGETMLARTAAPALLATIYLLSHAALYLRNEAVRPVAFLMGDRSASRLDTLVSMSEVVESVSWSSAFLAYGSPGDYIFHLVPLMWGGVAGVVAAQVAAGVIGLLAFHSLARRCLATGGLAFAAAVVYALFPGRLLHPHVLSTEAFFTPLLVGHVALLVRAVADERGRTAALLGAGVLAGIAVFLRPPFVLFPLLEAVALIGFSRIPRPRIAACLVPALLIGLASPATSAILGGSFGWGVSGHSLESNLYHRARRIVGQAGVRLDPAHVRSRTISLGEIAALALDHPLATLRTVAADVPTWSLNLGVNGFAGRYLELYELPRSRSHLFRELDRKGPAAALLDTARTWPAAFWWNVPTTLAWVALCAAAGVGIFRVRRRNLLDTGLWLTLLALPVYVIAVSHAANGLRWGHRAPVEFVVVLFAFWALAVGRSKGASDPGDAAQA